MRIPYYGISGTVWFRYPSRVPGNVLRVVLVWGVAWRGCPWLLSRQGARLPSTVIFDSSAIVWYWVYCTRIKIAVNRHLWQQCYTMMLSILYQVHIISFVLGTRYNTDMPTGLSGCLFGVKSSVPPDFRPPTISLQSRELCYCCRGGN